MQKAKKLNLLDHFYDHLEEDDWLDGVDLYQAGRVHDIAVFGGLITGKTSSTSRAQEVRVKIHPAGHCIQWIECTCSKNRVQGHYCEHIAALMIHIDRERPELFGNLDSSMPLKPPTSPRKSRSKEQTATRKSQDAKKDADAAQTILDHLKGNIQGISLLAHGPTLRVRIEIKPGQLTHYDLGLDAAAQFIAEHDQLPSATREVMTLRIFEEKAELGTRIYQPEEEKIVAERGIAVKLQRHLTKSERDSIRLSHEVGLYRRITVKSATMQPEHQKRKDQVQGDDDLYLFVPLKSASRYIGNEYFFIPGQGYWPLDKSEAKSAWNDLPLTKTFKEDEAANLARRNYEDYIRAAPIFVDHKLKNQVVLDAPQLAEIKVLRQSNGWFHLDPRYGEGKAKISMVDLMKQHRSKRRKYIRSGDVWLKIPEFITEHDWQLDEDGKSLKVDALGLLRLRAAVGDFDQFMGSKRVLNQIRNELEFKPESTKAVPHNSKIKLRHYQDMGLRWLWWLYQNRLHGLLADEMGLGKTHQAMALMSAIRKERGDGKFLVVAPTTVLDHWMDKIEEYAPDLVPVKFHGPKRSHHLKKLDSGHHTMVTSYGVMLRDIRHLAPRQWDAVILDEAHFVKNNDTATYKSACRLNSRIRICLTGTPMENHLGELKNLFDFLVPGYMGSDEYFRKHFIQPIEQKENASVELALQKLIHPFKMRRTKEQVLPDLPAKVEDLRHCGLSDEQIKMYRHVLAMKAAPLVKQLQDESNPVPYLHVFATLTMLKQICNHPALISKDSHWSKHESGKLELLKELLDEALGSGHKVVIYSQYVGMIKIIKEYLAQQHIRHEVLTGQTRNRGAVIQRFQTDPECKIFLGSLLAGGIGIDLTAASIVIHYDRWWNASKENQATDRVHRIGQNKNVQVLKLIARGTLEEKIDRMIQRKQKIFEKFLDKDEEIFKSLSRSELIDLLQ